MSDLTTNGRVRLCERLVDDGGEWVFCHSPAIERDADGMWVCRSCNREATDSPVTDCEATDE